MDKVIGLIFGMSIVGVLFWFVYVDIKKDLTVVDTKVELLDGTIYNCIEATSYSSGMTHMRLKNKNIIIPSKRIKIIERIK
jgi:hypothetical protein